MPKVGVEVQTEYQPEGMDALKNDVDRTASSVENAGGRMEDALGRVGEKAEETGERIAKASEQSEFSSLKAAKAFTKLGSSGVVVADVMGRVAKGELSVFKGGVMLLGSIISMAEGLSTLTKLEWGHIGALIAKKASLIAATAASWAHTIAENARAIASAIANAVGSVGVLVPVMIAAAAAVAVGVLAAQARAPSRQVGGMIPFTGPYMLHAGERVMARGAVPITINIYGATEPEATGRAIVDSLRRAGVI